jgi:hypothetical protein
MGLKSLYENKQFSPPQHRAQRNQPHPYGIIDFIPITNQPFNYLILIQTNIVPRHLTIDFHSDRRRLQPKGCFPVSNSYPAR